MNGENEFPEVIKRLNLFLTGMEDDKLAGALLDTIHDKQTLWLALQQIVIYSHGALFKRFFQHKEAMTIDFRHDRSGLLYHAACSGRPAFIKKLYGESHPGEAAADLHENGMIRGLDALMVEAVGQRDSLAEEMISKAEQGDLPNALARLAKREREDAIALTQERTARSGDVQGSVSQRRVRP